MAVIAVLIMVILVALVMRNLGETSDVISSCEDKGGRCSYDACSERFDGYTISNPTWTCAERDQRCCVRG